MSLLLFLLFVAHGWAAGPAAPDTRAPQMKNVPELEDLGGIEESPDLAPMTDERAIEARTSALATRMRCPVCQGLSVEASAADAARNMRRRIRDFVEAGYSDDQIYDFFIARYGTWVLLEPPAEGLNWSLYLVPGTIILGGGLWMVFLFRRMSQSPVTPAAEDEDTASIEPVDPYKARVLAELGERGDS